jgi:hypothetical protein
MKGIPEQEPTYKAVSSEVNLSFPSTFFIFLLSKQLLLFKKCFIIKNVFTISPKMCS